MQADLRLHLLIPVNRPRRWPPRPVAGAPPPAVSIGVLSQRQRHREITTRKLIERWTLGDGAAPG
jgi:hypothetical protein